MLNLAVKNLRRGSKPPAPLPPEPIYENLKPQEIQRNLEVQNSFDDKPVKRRAPPKPVGAPLERPNSWGKKKPAPQPGALKKFESNGTLSGTDLIKPKLNPVREMQMIGRNKAGEVLNHHDMWKHCKKKIIFTNSICRVTTKLRSISRECYAKRNTIELQ